MTLGLPQMLCISPSIPYSGKFLKGLILEISKIFKISNLKANIQ